MLVVLFLWHRSTGSIAVDRITTRKNEIFYWLTILVSNTLGTALGDFVATDAGLNFGRITSSLMIAAGMVLLISVTSLRQRAAASPEAAAH